MEMDSEICMFSWLIDSLDRHGIRQILIDETLVEVDGLGYWLWLA